ncbi:MAG: acyltransferase [Chloroflexota bacterium]
MTSRRVAELDLLRVGALVGVVVIHAGAWLVPAGAPPDGGWVQAILGLARCSVPAFVFASGFALFYVYGAARLDPPSFLKRRATRALIPWLLWVPVFLVVGLLHGDVQTRPGPAVTWLVYGPGHLYFLILIAQFYLVFLVLPRTTGRLAAVAALAVVIQLGLSVWHAYGPVPGSPWVWLGTYLAHEEWPFWAGYFVLGCLAAAEYERLSRWSRLWPLLLPLAALAFALYWWEGSRISPSFFHEGTYAFLWPSRLPLTGVLVLLTLWWGQRLGLVKRAVWPALRAVSQYSLGIYIVHPLVLLLIGPWTAPLPTPVRLFTLTATSLGAAYAAVALMARTRLGALAVGDSAIGGHGRAPANHPMPAAA